MSEKKVNLHIAELAIKWRTGQLSPEEKAELDSWYASFDDTLLEADSPESVDQLQQRIYASLADRMRAEGDERIGAEDGRAQTVAYEEAQSLRLASEPIGARRRIWPRYAVAAALLLLTAGTWLLLHQKSAEPIVQTSHQDIAPGGNKAILTLANGQQIVLDDAHNGQLAQQQNISIEKTDSGSIRYVVGVSNGKVASGGENGAANGRTNDAGTNGMHNAGGPVNGDVNETLNSISTPRGGQYAVRLSDGTRVILNASSSIKYPAVFSGSTRSVQLTGEAWFDVAPDKQHPFLVSTPSQDLEVLGTEFNLNAYDDEPGTKTTLLAGSVKITDHINHRSGILKPGQQSILNDHNLSFTEADTEEAIAWKNGYFMFHSEDITSIMRKIARWYDVNVVYDGPKPVDQFNGTVQRLVNVSQVLKKLELTNSVHFKIEGRTITVSR